MNLDNIIDKVVGEVRNHIKLRRYIRENKWNGLAPGDIVELDNIRYMYIRLDQNGVIGIPIVPLSYFVRADPHETPDTIYYLNETYKQFGESRISGPRQVIPLNAQRSALKKVGHYSPREWNRMVQEAKLSGNS
nr:hypothetical protein [Candidatus Woesearchaeota archaeon]